MSNRFNSFYLPRYYIIINIPNLAWSETCRAIMLVPVSQTNCPFSTSDEHNMAELEGHGRSINPPSQPVRGIVRMSVSTESQLKQSNKSTYISYIFMVRF